MCVISTKVIRVVASILLLSVTACAPKQVSEPPKVREQTTPEKAPPAAVDEKAKEIEACAKEVELIKKGNLGPKPPFSEDVVKKDLKYKLFDPFTAQYDIGKPRRGVVLCGLSSDPDGYWMVPVLVNAKNKFGAYAGWNTYIYNWTDVGGKKQWGHDWFEFIVNIYGDLFHWEEEEAQTKVLKSIMWVD